LFGGRSGEHEISVRSAASVVQGLAVLHDVLPVLVDRRGGWKLQDGPGVSEEGGTPVFLVPSPSDRGVLRRLQDGSMIAKPDIYFPVLHGTFGEDGTIQGLFELADVPYVGAGVLASAVGMDKEMMKAVFQSHGLPIVEYLVVRRHEWQQAPERVGARVAQTVGFPCFVKPVNLGSSVGISKVASSRELPAAIDLAARHDRKIIIERGIDAREIEVSVLGNEEPKASLPGEISYNAEWYDYSTKYLEGQSRLTIPAPVSAETTRRLQELAVAAFRAIDCSGMARVDFFVERSTDRVVVNEINTIPGFTATSAYAKMWAASGLPYAELVDRLIQLALERHQGKGGG
ncbi:MAG TPA: D-alanine--D-alanine ligase family protein, partial [Methylomirabilota bacterium]|nr:D-alanine--D-alanine ligase family protein [Methylomirabilota bacterium]